jgi:hypothetical protein
MAESNVTLSATVGDLKLVYRVLHQHLSEHIELMDSELFSALQRRLQEHAKSEGVDVTDHAAWDVWLGNADAPSCDERMRMRRRPS